MCNILIGICSKKDRFVEKGGKSKELSAQGVLSRVLVAIRECVITFVSFLHTNRDSNNGKD